MTRWIRNLSQALQALNVHRRRSALSVLGITLAITAVMAVGTISRGGDHLVYRELETFGLNSVWLYRDWYTQNPEFRKKPGSGIDIEDFRDLQHNKDALGIRNITPLVYGPSDWISRQGSREAEANVIGVGRAYTTIVNDKLVEGRLFNQNDIDTRQPIVLLAPQSALLLTDPSQNPVGQRIYVDGKRFLVVGTLAGKSRDLLASIGAGAGQTADDRILMPYTTMHRMLGHKEIDDLQLEVDKFEAAEAVAESARQRLLRNHPTDYAYSAQTMSAYIAPTNRILSGISIIGVVSASISLLVGGMGIMNVMGTAVLERTREIGIRKAVGAREKDIMMQFLMEAGLISTVGGLLGLLIGSIASIALAEFTGFPLVPSLKQVMLALMISVFVGLASGLIPARRAARMKPVQALRSE